MKKHTFTAILHRPEGVGTWTYLDIPFAVEEAFNGVEALEKILAHPFDLLVVDVNMPKMNGYTLLRALRGRADAHAATPALMTSTEAGPQDIDAAEAAGASYYLVKPVTQEDLVLHAKALTGRSP